MSKFGSRFVGENRLYKKRSLNYHVADRNGRTYLCGCFRGIRIGKRYKWGGRTIKTTGLNYLRRWM